MILNHKYPYTIYIILYLIVILFKHVQTILKWLLSEGTIVDDHGPPGPIAEATRSFCVGIAEFSRASLQQGFCV